jgi:hypothetical protein
LDKRLPLCAITGEAGDQAMPQRYHRPTCAVEGNAAAFAGALVVKAVVDGAVGVAAEVIFDVGVNIAVGRHGSFLQSNAMMGKYKGWAIAA